jgi:hypothetical protein
LAGQSCAWLMEMSTLDADKRAALRQGGLFD